MRGSCIVRAWLPNVILESIYLLSDKTLAALSKYIRLELLPTQDDQEGWKNETSPALIALPISAIETALKAVMQRNNYGLDRNDGGKVPAALCVWRWEVKEQFRDWLPKNGREKADSRQAERIQVNGGAESMCAF